MAVSAIGPISNATAFIQPPLTQLDRLTAPEAFARIVETSLSGPPVAPEALARTARTQDLVSVLEQVLLRDLVDNAQRTDLSGFMPALERVLTNDLGLSLPLSADAVESLLQGASTTERAAFAAAVSALFSTVQLLGTEADQEPRIGGLLDMLA